jgi:UDP-GlcNAc:undecaprenyl-phosphate GlcNAc-1-phosphate transferase
MKSSLAILSFIPAGVAFLIATFSTPLIIKLVTALGLIDDPREKKHPKVIHTYPVPRGGGLAILLAIIGATIFFLPLDQHTLAIGAGAIILTFLGLADDKWNLSPYLRLAFQFIAAWIPIAAGIGITFLSNPFNGIVDLSSYGSLPNIITLLWIVTLMNFLNMGAKGVDGQLPGVVTIASATIAILSLQFSADIAQWPVIILASITAGAYLGFLPWNLYPQKIMPGFGGSNLAGYLLGISSILSTTKVGVLTVVLGVPLIDTGYTIIRRISQGKSPIWGDTGHLHHRLLQLGWSKMGVAAFYWSVTAVLGIIALNLNTLGKIYTIIGLIILIGGLILWLTYRPRQKK